MTLHRRAAVLALVAAVAGCSSPGSLVARHAPATPVGVTHVAAAGTYGLFIAGQGEPLLQFPLAAGDPIGFETGTRPAGNQLQVEWLYGVAGHARGRLDVRQTYEWRQLPEQN